MNELDKVVDLQKNYFKKTSPDIATFKDKLVKSKESYPDSGFEDKTRNQVSLLFEGKVGERFNNTKYASLVQNGVDRYQKEVPPGYCDAKEKDKDDPTKTRKFGDLIGWMQMIEKSKETGKPIIFITSEQKEDWWRIVKGKITGPRFELIKEFSEETGQKFYMYDMERFLDYAKETYSISQKTLAEVKEKDKLNSEMTNDNQSSDVVEGIFSGKFLVGEFQEESIASEVAVSDTTPPVIKEISLEIDEPKIDF